LELFVLLAIIPRVPDIELGVPINFIAQDSFAMVDFPVIILTLLLPVGFPDIIPTLLLPVGFPDIIPTLLLPVVPLVGQQRTLSLSGCHPGNHHLESMALTKECGH
jgi:hypothetical protein